MSEKKTRLPLQRKQNWKTVKAETEKNKQMNNIYLNNNQTELKELIYAGAKSVWDTLGVHLKFTNKKSKPECEIRLKTQIRNKQQAKVIRHRKNARICWDEKNETQQVKQKSRGNKSEVTGDRRNINKITRQDNTIQQIRTFQNNKTFYLQVWRIMQEDISSTG